MQPGRPDTRTAIVDALAQHRAALDAFVRARVPAAEVDDVLQIAAMKAVEAHATLEEPDRVLAWLYRIHRNVVSDTARKRQSLERLAERAERATVSDEEIAWPVTLEGEMCRCSVAQTEFVAEPYAEILRLVDLGELSVPEASKVLGISANNAAVRLHRARKALRKRMLEHCGVTSLRECADCRCVDEGCCIA